MDLQFNLGNSVSQQQQLTLAPQLLQWLRLLQVPSHELEQLVREELISNPALEEVDSFDADDMPGEESGMESDAGDGDGLDERMEILAEMGQEWGEEVSSGSDAEHAASRDRMDYRMSIIEEATSMRTHLLGQISVMGLTEGVKAAAEYIIGTLTEAGRLEVALEELSGESGYDLFVMEEALGWVQACEPMGIGARSLKECLLLQLPMDEEANRLSRQIVEHGLEAVAQGRLNSIARHLGESIEAVEEAVAQIRTLNPYPGRVIGDEASIVTVTPDVIIRHEPESGEFEIEVVERYVPRLRISRACRLLIEKGSSLSRAELSYVRKRVRAAMFLIEGVNKRRETLHRIAQEIIRVQHRFLRGEETDIRPLTMSKVAGIIGVHDTTVSRALAEKYVECPSGIFPMKHFFRAGYQCDDGSALSPDKVRERIERIIRDENATCPVKDEVIAQQLKEEGIPVARRTVAKYRGELGLPSSKERRVLATA